MPGLGPPCRLAGGRAPERSGERAGATSREGARRDQPLVTKMSYLLVGGVVMHYRAPECPPRMVCGLMAAGEAFYGIAGGCRAASPLPTLRECTMPGAHAHTPRSPHVSHAVAAALCYFLRFVRRLSHEAVLDS